MKVKLFIVAIICLLQSCSTTDFLDEQRVETISMIIMRSLMLFLLKMH